MQQKSRYTKKFGTCRDAIRSGGLRKVHSAYLTSMLLTYYFLHLAGGGKASATTCDVTNETDLAKVVSETVEKFGKHTHVVSNAGGGGPKPFDMPMTDFKRAFDLNVFSLFRLAQLAVPEIERAGGGAILAIISMAGENKNIHMASYGASKTATNHLIRNIAFDLGPRGIRLNGITPGATRTTALKSVLNDEIEKKMLEHTPIHRLGEPQDMANAALFLCSPASELGKRTNPHRIRRRHAGNRLNLLPVAAEWLKRKSF